MEGMYGWTAIRENVPGGESRRSSPTTRKPPQGGSGGLRTFVGRVVVKAAEGLVLGDVRVEELERVLGDHAVRDDLVVADDVGQGQRVEAALGVRLH